MFASLLKSFTSGFNSLKFLEHADTPLAVRSPYRYYESCNNKIRTESLSNILRIYPTAESTVLLHNIYTYPRRHEFLNIV